MSTISRVLRVLEEDWCGEKPFGNDDPLIELWDRTRKNPNRPHTSIDFQPDGVELLIEDVKSEFRKVPGKNIVLTPASFDPSGRVKLVEDLVTAISISADLPGSADVGIAETIAPAMATAPVDSETLRLYAVLHEWCGDRPVHVYEPLIELWERTRLSKHQPHKGVPFQLKALGTLARAVNKEFGDAAIKEGDFAPKGVVRDVDDLLRKLHSKLLSQGKTMKSKKAKGKAVTA